MEAHDTANRRIFDFGPEAEPWPSIDDVVMGGVSKCEMILTGSFAVFRGDLSLENDGGFASVRSRPAEHALEGYAGIALRVRGDGRTYGVRLRTTAAFDGVSYQAPLATRAGEWTEHLIPFTEFEPVFRGRRVADAPALDPGAIRTFAFLLADQDPGPFRLEIDWIEAYRG